MTLPTSKSNQDSSSEANTGATGVEHESGAAEKIEEPEVPGTVFLTLILLMMIFGFWAMMYVILIDL